MAAPIASPWVEQIACGKISAKMTINTVEIATEIRPEPMTFSEMTGRVSFENTFMSSRDTRSK